MSLQIEGTYEDGRVVLSSTPQGISKARVVVTFVEAGAGVVPAAADNERRRAHRPIYRGMFKGPVVINEEDFKLAEWHGDREEDDLR